MPDALDRATLEAAARVCEELRRTLDMSRMGKRARAHAHGILDGYFRCAAAIRALADAAPEREGGAHAP